MYSTLVGVIPVMMHMLCIRSLDEDTALVSNYFVVFCCFFFLVADVLNPRED